MAQAAASLQFPKILVVEDDAALLTMLTRILEPSAQVFTASDGAEALTIMQSQVISLVITDVMMPKMDGVTLAREMKKVPALAKIPVIMLTAKNTPKDVVIGINAGARHYIPKPFKAEDLLAKVQKTLGR